MTSKITKTPKKKHITKTPKKKHITKTPKKRCLYRTKKIPLWISFLFHTFTNYNITYITNKEITNKNMNSHINQERNVSI